MTFSIKDSDAFLISQEVQRAQRLKQPLVALESTVITHGLPHPENVQLALDMEREVRQFGATPATIAVMEGYIRVGMSVADLEALAKETEPVKVSRRDFANAYVGGYSGGTTVAGTMYAAHAAGIKVFATGGIGGVHKESRFDISADLYALSDTPMVVVCAGAKSILDLPSTLEYLETLGVPVMGYKTEEFPAFFSTTSGLPTSTSADTPEDVVEFAHAHWDALGFKSAILVAQPIPAADAIPDAEIHPAEEQASREAVEQGIRGQELTPFLLKRVNELTKGRSLRANLSLLKNNAKLAAQIARAFQSYDRQWVA